MQNGVTGFLPATVLRNQLSYRCDRAHDEVSREEAELLKRGESVAGVSKEAVEDVLSSASDEIMPRSTGRSSISEAA